LLKATMVDEVENSDRGAFRKKPQIGERNYQKRTTTSSNQPRDQRIGGRRRRAERKQDRQLEKEKRPDTKRS